MSTILAFRKPDFVRSDRTPPPDGAECEIVIFPGVRIERHDLDLGHRLRDCAGRREFDRIGNTRPRKTS